MPTDPNRPLLDPKRELFAQLMSQNVPIVEAYAQAGYTPDRKNALRLAQKPEVHDRIAALMKPALLKHGITRDRVMKEIAALAFSDIRDVVRWGNIATVTGETEDGEPIVTHFNDVAFINSADLTPEAAAGVAEVKRSADGAISIKMHPKTPNLKLLAEIIRLTQPTPDDKDKAGGGPISLTQNVFNMTPDEVSTALAKAFRKATQPHVRTIDGTAAEDAG